MLNSQSTQAIALAKESYPHALVFLHTEGLYVVAGPDAELLRHLFSIESASGWLAFDPVQTQSYLDRLTTLGRKVVLLRDGKARELRSPAIKKARLVKASFLALDPLLLFERHEIESATGPDWLRDDFEQVLTGISRKRLADFGAIFVYGVDSWYEVDTELTSMPPHHLKLLARVAVETGTKLPCQLVEPKPRRRYHVVPKTRVIQAPTQDIALGQLRLL